jgi:hypothetical protein
MDKSFHTSFEQATGINECYENDPTPAGLVDRGLQTSRLPDSAQEPRKFSGLKYDRFALWF